MSHSKKLIPNTALAQTIKEFECVGLDNVNELIKEASEIIGVDNWNRIDICVKKL